AKVDSASIEYQNLQKDEKIYDFSGEKGEILANVKMLEKQRIEYQEKINALNSVSNNIYQAGSKGMIDLQIVGLDEGNFSSEVNNLRQMELERDNLRLLYKEGSREIKELDARINNTKSNIQHLIATSRSKVNKELGNRSEEHTSELQSRENIVCRLLLE